MREAVRLGIEGMRNNEGGPFGCVIVKDDEIVGRGCNRVITATDPTAHAEIVAIRDACSNLNNFQLEGCELYTSCEPCPMCMGAIYWARPKKVYYANTREDAANIGFDDHAIYEELEKNINNRKMPMQNIGREDAIKMFEEWRAKPDKNCY